MQASFKNILPKLQRLSLCAAPLLLTGAPAFADSPAGTPAYVDFHDHGKTGVVVWRKSDGVWNVRVLSAKGVNPPVLKDIGSLNGQIVSDSDSGDNSDISLKVLPALSQVAGFTDIAEIDLSLAPVTASSACTAKGCKSLYFQIASPMGDTASYCAVEDIYEATPTEAAQKIRSEYKTHPDYVITRLGSYRNFLEACGPTGA